MTTWVCPYWVLDSFRADDGLFNQVRVTEVVITNPTDRDATVDLIFYEARAGGEYVRSDLFGGRWTVPAGRQLGYRPDIRGPFSGVRAGWFHVVANVRIVPHVYILRRNQRATDAGLTESYSEHTVLLREEPPTLGDLIVSVPDRIRDLFRPRPLPGTAQELTTPGTDPGPSTGG